VVIKLTNRVTATDVAREAGVSQSAVSLVMSGKWRGRIAPAVADRIQRTAANMDYQPNLAARSLRRGVTGSVLLAIPTLSNPFFADVHSGAARVGEAHDIGLVVFPANSDDDPGPFQSPHQAIDGVLACALRQQDTLALSAGLPLVLLDDVSGNGIPSVTFDLDLGVTEAIAHLAELGHQHVLHVRAGRDATTFHRRAAAFADEIARRPGMIGSELVCPITLPEALDTVMRELSRTPRPSAVFCDDDNLAMAVYAAAVRLGLTIPNQLSVIGVDDLPIATVMTPPLTTIALPAYDLGRLGMLALVELRQGRAADSASLPVSLQVRASTAPPAVR
jgi:DNA-binding LacI/PurR family transcriptional regulator